jgi:hypothetical protein
VPPHDRPCPSALQAQHSIHKLPLIRAHLCSPSNHADDHRSTPHRPPLWWRSSGEPLPAPAPQPDSPPYRGAPRSFSPPHLTVVRRISHRRPCSMKATLPCFQQGLPAQPGMGRPDLAQCGHGPHANGQQAAPGPVCKWAPEIRPVTVYSIFDFFFHVNNSRNQVKVLKSMEKFRSIQFF